LLAGVAAGAAAEIDLGGAEPLVSAWWRHRSERLSAAERGAFFSRLFGTSAGAVSADAAHNGEFEECMLGLCEALYKLDETPSVGPHGDYAHQARVRSAARELARNLGAASTGVTAYMAGEIAGMLKDAFAILGHADLKHTFGARDIWGVVAGITRLSHRPNGQPAAYVRRGKAGMTVLAWLAECADSLVADGPLVSTDNPVLAAAAEWIEATLSLGEHVAAALPSMVGAGSAATTGSPRPPSQDSGWASLGR